MTMCPLPDPDAWEVNPSGTHKALDERDIRLAELEAEIKSLRLRKVERAQRNDRDAARQQRIDELVDACDRLSESNDEAEQRLRETRAELAGTRLKLAEALECNRSLQVKLQIAQRALKFSDEDLAQVSQLVTNIGRILAEEKIRAQA